MFLFLVQTAAHQKLKSDQRSNSLQPVNICVIVTAGLVPVQKRLGQETVNIFLVINYP